MKKLFLQNLNKISPLVEEPFAKELVLQDLLEKHPELIPSDEIIGNPSFLMVQRELPVSTGFIDHFLIDQMMVPTVIETKVNNPEIRRKIIGQGYEYLTSLSLEFTGKQIVEYTKRYWKGDFDRMVKEKLDLDKLNEKEIDRNLKRPRLRLIFAADFIPRELRKFIEFINNASRGIDVYALQIEQFPLDDKKILSVTTYGPTENTINDKSLSFGLMSREEFINKINQSEELTKEEKVINSERVNFMLDLVEELGFSISWGTKSLILSYKDSKSNNRKLLEIYYYGAAYVVYIPKNERTEKITKLYELFDQVFDLQKSYLRDDSFYKQGKINFFKLNQQKFDQFLDALKFTTSIH